MKVQAIAISVFMTPLLFFPGTACAFFIDGSQLAQSMREYDKAAANSPGVNFAEVNNFTAYVAGAYDTLELANLICKPSELSRRQLNAVVSKHLKEVPEGWHRPAAILISEALKKAFPCAK